MPCESHLEHVGISVANLERSLKFYREFLGMEAVVINATFQGARYERIFALKNASGRVALLKKGDIQFELFEFSNPAPKAGDPQRPVCDHGITHYCIRVADVDAEYARLIAAGVPFHCAPLEFGSAKATYGRDPDGNVFELLQYVECTTSTSTR